jgi:integrase/recombinase XerC
MFMGFICDPRYRWVSECEDRFGEHPVQNCHEWNTADHVADYEGRPGRRPFTRGELQAFFDHIDDAVSVAQRHGRKGAVAAWRDATMFKVTYAWGLRRREVTMLDTVDFTANPAAPELGRFGMLAVRYGKAMRGSPPRRRNVASVTRRPRRPARTQRVHRLARTVDRYHRRRDRRPRAASVGADLRHVADRASPAAASRT